MSIDARLVSGRITIGGKLAGTAWRCASKIAITAAHCLRVDPIQKQYHSACEIWFNDDSMQPTKGTVRVVNGVQCLDEKLDIAVLDLDREGSNYVRIATPSWQDVIDRKWTSYGYPDAKPDGLGLSGTITHIEERLGRGIQLACTQGGRGNLKHASGSPVIVEDRAIGLIVWNPEPLLQQVIYARSFDVVPPSFDLKPQIHPRFPIVGHLQEQLHLECDRDAQWGEFDGWIKAPPSISSFFVTGPDREAPEKFIARIEQTTSRRDPSRYQLRTVRWSGGFPPSAQADFRATLSRGLFESELSEDVLAAQILELAQDTKLVIKHPIIDLTSDSTRLRLDDIFTYYYATLPQLFARHHPLRRGVRGVMFLQPFYWEPYGLGRFLGLFNKDPWAEKIREQRASPLHPISASPFTQIKAEHVKRLLGNVQDLSETVRDALLREVPRYRTSRGVLKFLEERIG